jgi:CheY-like chemotaxis protein
MTSSDSLLNVLVVDDDPEVIAGLQKTLPRKVNEYHVVWEYERSFEVILDLMKVRRFDLIVLDIYRDRSDKIKTRPEDRKASGEIIQAIRATRFCPIVVYSDGTLPEEIKLSTFVQYADKAAGNDKLIEKINNILQTGVPQMARKLHDELDKSSGSYLWNFLEDNWVRLQDDEKINQQILERLIRKRASTQIGRISSAEGKEIENIEGLEFYIRPSISGDTYRLGEVIRHKQTKDFRVILTPHCHLAVQKAETKPRADFILTVQSFSAKDIIKKEKGDKAWKGKEEEITDALRKRINSPAGLGRPDGRYWFLPGFLDIPDMYCDFLQLESIPYDSLQNDYERIATLDGPFAEALQSCFARFYLAVGIPNLNPENFKRMTQ